MDKNKQTEDCNSYEIELPEYLKWLVIYSASYFVPALIFIIFEFLQVPISIDFNIGFSVIFGAFTILFMIVIGMFVYLKLEQKDIIIYFDCIRKWNKYNDDIDNIIYNSKGSIIDIQNKVNQLEKEKRDMVIKIITPYTEYLKYGDLLYKIAYISTSILLFVILCNIISWNIVYYNIFVQLITLYSVIYSCFTSIYLICIQSKMNKSLNTFNLNNNATKKTIKKRIKIRFIK